MDSTDTTTAQPRTDLESQVAWLTDVVSELIDRVPAAEPHDEAQQLDVADRPAVRWSERVQQMGEQMDRAAERPVALIAELLVEINDRPITIGPQDLERLLAAVVEVRQLVRAYLIEIQSRVDAAEAIDELYDKHGVPLPA